MKVWTAIMLAALAGCSFIGPGIFHPVSRGETLWDISQAYGVDADTLAAANRRLPEGGGLRGGEMVYVPGARNVRKIRASSLSFIWPVQGEVVTPFGRHGNQRSLGIGIKADEGGPVAAAESGTVVFTSEDFRMYGKTILIDHGAEYTTVYAHNSSILVSDGQSVLKGQKIAEAGRSGHVSGPVLHFEIRYREEPRNPLHLLP